MINSKANTNCIIYFLLLVHLFQILRGLKYIHSANVLHRNNFQRVFDVVDVVDLVIVDDVDVVDVAEFLCC